MSEAACRTLAAMLEARTGQHIDTHQYWRIEAALAPMIRAHGLGGLDALAVRVAARADLAEAAIDALLNNETSFFRDAAMFDLLATRGLGRLEQARRATRRLSLWSAGCSTGQEVWSLAMLFAREPARWAGWTIDILGTDVSHMAVATARAGWYSHFEVQRGLPASAMIRWFSRDADRWRVSDALAPRVRFTVRSLLGPPPPMKFDVILCRNVLLYFPPPARRLALARLAEAIRPDGILMLGAGETAFGCTEAFVSDYEARGLYRPARPAADARGLIAGPIKLSPKAG